MRPEDNFPWFRQYSLSFPQCWMGDRKDIRLIKKPVLLIHKGSLPKEMEQQNQGEMVNWVHMKSNC